MYSIWYLLFYLQRILDVYAYGMFSFHFLNFDEMNE